MSARRFLDSLRSYRIVFILVALSVVLFLVVPQLNHESVIESFQTLQANTLDQLRYYSYPESGDSSKDDSDDLTKTDKPVYYAVFCSNTPNGMSYRTYDYAYNLPLTALAWERIGFKSVALIIGSRCEWENDPALNLVLSHLEARRATAIFIKSPLEYRTTLSQTARAFAVNMKDFPGKDSDFLITSDSDLWPLRKEHYTPLPKYNVHLVHAGCCGKFTVNNKTYEMFPMSNIGANVGTWKEIMNEGHPLAYDAETILDYFGEIFGEQARSPVVVGQETWYMDQRLISIRLTEWMDKHGTTSVYRVSDRGFGRVDRSGWDAHLLVPENFTNRFDAHLPGKGFLPVQWKKIQPLVNLMYGNNSWEARWVEEYTQEFLAKVKNYVGFNDLG